MHVKHDIVWACPNTENKTPILRSDLIHPGMGQPSEICKILQWVRKLNLYDIQASKEKDN